MDFGRDSGSGSPPVLLVSMPFAWSRSPSIGISLLKAILERAGIGVDLRYLNLEFADRIGHMLHNVIAADHAGFVGDWIFSAALNGMPSQGESDAYWRDMSTLPLNKPDRDPTQRRDDVSKLQVAASRFIDDVIDSVDWSNYRIVGFTSTFQQDVAALALARRVKEVAPATQIVFGGAHYEGEMGASRLRCFDFIDAVFSGEADTSFPIYVRHVLAGESPRSILGCLTRSGGADAAPQASLTSGFMDLDGLPFPDYDDYFDQLARSKGRFDVELPFESARGCWWGAKHHCTFCGLNGANMAFRRKSPDRLLEEVTSLYNRYGDRIRGMFDVSNILDMKYFDDFIPKLSRLAVSDDFYIFAETKSNLSRSQVAALADARITIIQPGIESLSTPILKLMRKGCTSLQNIELLKWCQLSDVRPEWNLLYGFPGEDRGEYDRQIELMPLLHHLPPPANVGPVRVDRFSPYFETPEDFGITALNAQAPYRHVYHIPADELTNIAYYFDFRCRTVQTDDYAPALEDSVQNWRQAFGRVELSAYRLDDGLMIHDTRACAVQEWTLLEGPHAHAIELLETSLSDDRLLTLLATKGLSLRLANDVQAELLDRRFVIKEGTRSVSVILTLDAECPISPDRVRGVSSAALAVV